MASLQMSAQIRGNNIVVTVEPDHKDWNYKTGEKAQFVVEVRKSGTLIDGVNIDYAAGPEMYQNVRKSLVLKDGTLKLSGTMKQPGFYRVARARCLKAERQPCDGHSARRRLHHDRGRRQYYPH